MKPRTKRALAIVAGLATLGVATALVLNAFQSNLVFFFSPTQVASNEAPRTAPSASAAWSKPAACSATPDGLTVHFVVTDTAKTVPVSYTGMLPGPVPGGQGRGRAGPARAGRRLPRRPGAGQARRELHAARGRRGAGQGAAGADALARAPDGGRK